MMFGGKPTRITDGPCGSGTFEAVAPRGLRDQLHTDALELARRYANMSGLDCCNAMVDFRKQMRGKMHDALEVECKEKKLKVNACKGNGKGALCRTRKRR